VNVPWKFITYIPYMASMSSSSAMSGYISKSDNETGMDARGLGRTELELPPPFRKGAPQAGMTPSVESVVIKVLILAID
jgi:hypothetical protein